MKTLILTCALYLITAVAEIIGCYLPYLWLRQDRSPWLLVPAAFSLCLFAWLLTLHPTATGRTYAAYGGIYTVTALLWLWKIDEIRPGRWDLIGVVFIIIGATTIVLGGRSQ